MLKTTLTTLTLVVLVATGGTAQQPQPVLPQTKPETAMPQTGPRTPAQLANIRLELSITDQRGDGAAAPKVVTMIVADRENGRIRTGRGQINLNVDARPEIPREGRIRVSLTLEYRPQSTDSDKGEPMAISESLTAILEDGKPMVVSQSADPGSDRRVKVELKATVLK